MRLLVTGRGGQVARSLKEIAGDHPGLELVFAARPDLDLEEPDRVAEVVASHRPDLVVSAAAWTQVDAAEDHAERAFTVNATGAGAVARGAASVGAPIIHVSTDYVFSGDQIAPYSEHDRPAPINVYGASKLAGEEAVVAENGRHVILRTSWVYGPFGQNFMKTMLRLAGERPQIRVVSDQVGNPTSSLDIARAIIAVGNGIAGRDDRYGLVHFAGAGSASWYEFAAAILERSREMGGPFAEVLPISSSEYPTRASRPARSCLDTTLFTSRFSLVPPSWKDSMTKALERLLAGGAE